MILKVYIPAEGSSLRRDILPGSAVLSEGRERDGLVFVHYEGNAYGASNLAEFNGRAVVAAGRLKTNYPTSASMAVPAADLVEVATFDAERNVFLDVTDPDGLRDWSGESLEEITGKLLDAGAHERIGEKDFLNQLNMLGADGGRYYYRSRAGQIVTAAGGGVFEVHDRDDPEIRERLASLLDPARLAWALGSEPSDHAPGM